MIDETRTPRATAGRRSLARLAAVQALYQVDISGTPIETVIAEFLKHRFERDADEENYGRADTALFSDIVKGTANRGAEVDQILSGVLTPEWPLERLEVTLRAILRAGTYELIARSDVPARVVISEYLDIAHAFFAGKEPGMVNGVLDRLARMHRQGDFQDGSGGGSQTA